MALTDWRLAIICPIHKKVTKRPFPTSVPWLSLILYVKYLKKTLLFFLVIHRQFHHITMVPYPVGLVSPICWSSRKRWHAWWIKATQFMIKRSFQDLSKSTFLPLYEALVRPQFECSKPAWSPKLDCCTCQPSGANSEIVYQVGNWHSLPPLERETAAVRPFLIAAATASGWPDNKIQDIHGPTRHGSELVFFSLSIDAA